MLVSGLVVGVGVLPDAVAGAIIYEKCPLDNIV
jgi:hypothetical protein